MKEMRIFIVLQYFVGSLGVVFCQEMYFRLVTDTRVLPQPLGNSWADDSQISCAVSCINFSSRCYSFTYDPGTKSCTPGTWTVRNSSSQNPSSEQLFSAVTCDLTAGFKMQSNKFGAMCYMIPTSDKNYIDAEQSCKEKGLQLVTLKTVEKFNLFLGIARKFNQSFWIGLNDLKVENTFIWSDDGSTLSPVMRSVIFKGGQPNNRLNYDQIYDQDCVEFSLDEYPYNDDYCFTKKPFMCEFVAPTKMTRRASDERDDSSGDDDQQK